MIHGEIVLLTGFTFVVSACFIPLTKHIAWRFKIVAKPSPDRWSERPVPLLGGGAIVAAFSSGTLLAPNRSYWLVGCTLLMFLVGLVDDVVNLKPRDKLLLQVLVIAAATLYTPTLEVFHHLTPLNFPITFAWILLVVNAFNLLDHLDGLSSGVGIVSSTAIGLLALLHSQFDLACWCFALVGALSGFLIYNWSPASIFMGDAGALAVGFLLGIFSAISSRSVEGGGLSKCAVALFLVLVPILDTSIVTITRLANGRAIWHGGRDHSSHRLVRIGLSERSATLVLYVSAILASGWALFFALAPDYYVIMILPLALLLFALLGICLINLSFDSTPPSRVYPTAPWLGQLILSLSYKRRIVELGLDSILIAAAYYGAVLIRDNPQDITPLSVSLITARLPSLLVPTYAAFFSCRIYQSIWHNVGIEDMPRFGAAAVLATIGASLLLQMEHSSVPHLTMLLFGVLLFNLLAFSRLSLRLFQSLMNKLARHLDHRILIVGTGAIAESAVRQFEQDAAHRGSLVGLLDQDPFRYNKRIYGRKIIGSLANLESIYHEKHFNSIVIADDSLSEADLHTIQSFAMSHKIDLSRYSVHEHAVPPVASWIPETAIR